MGSLISLLIYGAIAAAALGAIYAGVQGARHWVAAPFVAEQMASDQKVVDAANANQKSAELERDNAKTDTAACVSLSKRQGDAVEAWKSVAAANALAAKAAKERASKEATAQAPRIADLQAKAAAAPLLQSCEIERDKAKNILRDQLRQKRGIVPAVSPAVESPPALVK